MKPLHRKFFRSNIKANFVERIIEGYAAMWTPDRVRDRIRKGAFAKTVSERGPKPDPKTGKVRSRIKLGFNHGEIVGIPIHLHEDDTGLFYRGRVSKTRTGDEVLERVDDGSLDVSSFAYDIVKATDISEPDADTELIELRVEELGPVDFAANEDTFMLGAKAYKLYNGRDLTPALDIVEDLRSGKYVKTILDDVQKLTAALAGLTQLLGAAGKEEEDEEPDEEEAAEHGDETDEEDEAKSIYLPTTPPVRAKSSQTPAALEIQAILEELEPAQSQVSSQARLSQILELKQMLEGVI